MIGKLRKKWFPLSRLKPDHKLEKKVTISTERFIQLGEEECTKISVDFTGKIEHVMIKNKRKVTSRDRKQRNRDAAHVIFHLIN